MAGHSQQAVTRICLVADMTTLLTLTALLADHWVLVAASPSSLPAASASPRLRLGSQAPRPESAREWVTAVADSVGAFLVDQFSVLAAPPVACGNPRSQTSPGTGGRVESKYLHRHF